MLVLNFVILTLIMFSCFIRFIKRTVGEAFLISKQGGDVASQDTQWDAEARMPREGTLLSVRVTQEDVFPQFPTPLC